MLLLLLLLLSLLSLLLPAAPLAFEYSGRISAPPSTSNPRPFRAGFVAIVGAPNMGKSSLLNTLLDYNLAITNPRPQTTRHSILGILTALEHNTQLAFLDTPGVIAEPAYALQTTMMDAVKGSLTSADLLLVVTDIYTEVSPLDTVIVSIRKSDKNVVVVVNKMDLVEETTREIALDDVVKDWRNLLPNAHCIIPVSTKTKQNIPTLRKILLAEPDVPAALRDLGRPIAGMFKPGVTTITDETAVTFIPESPPMYEVDAVTDRSERFICGEIIRETLFSNLGKEVPYCCEVAVDGFTEGMDIRHVSAKVIVERDSQKGILIGQGGKKIKELGTAARKVLQKEFGVKIMLDLSVKVDKDWRKSEEKLMKYGYIAKLKKKKVE